MHRNNQMVLGIIKMYYACFTVIVLYMYIQIRINVNK